MYDSEGNLKLPFKILKTGVKIVSDICFLLIFCYLIFFIPMLFGYKMLTIEGYNSNASLKKGTLIYYQKVEPVLLVENDMILFKDGNDYKISTIHRVLAPKDSSSSDYSYQINDGNSQIKVKKYSKILGKVAGIKILYAGKYINYFNKHTGLFHFLIGIVALDVLVGSILSTIKQRKNRVKKKV